MFELEWLKDRVAANEYAYSKHADNERQNDNLLLSEIEEALLSGLMLEQYSDTGRGDSCLVAGFTSEGKPIHVVCGRRENKIVIVTAYIPKPPKFITPLKRGQPHE